ncbi:hypothetical protein NDU88_004507 [Pleurodeles waltl]|uniref:Uncharacterized protein n=1 Tax=Pleurodeles waltl TaxID=8319 RepID=A0AAV7W7P9_PLEWA|nr:hypothetical protein NDU88_004507 [Pleurodeles waltl]
MLHRELHTLDADIWCHEQLLLMDQTAAAPLAQARLARRSTLERLGKLNYRDYLTRKNIEGDKAGMLLA